MEETLKSRFGVLEFRPGQREAIEAVLAGRDVFVCMATGAGKSLCYQFPPVYSERKVTAIVISPLISLMEDQVTKLRARGIPACYVSFTMPLGEVQAIRDQVTHGDFRIVFIAPERLESWIPNFMQLYINNQLQLLAVDEAHCVSEWGHDFRPEYRAIGTLFRTNFPKVPIIALTATATERVQKEIVTNLKLNNPLKIVTSFNRPNITYKVMMKSGDCEKDLSFIIEDRNNSAIIYTPTIKETETISSMLSRHGVSCKKYSSVLGKEERSNTYSSFVDDSTQVVVATIAFGMGVDKPNVRFIINYGLPESLESYFQQSGRGGRDGEPAVSIIFWSKEDMNRNNFFANCLGPAGTRAQARRDFQIINDYVTDTVTCRRKLLLSYFGEKCDNSGSTTTNEECCDNCSHRPHTRKDLTLQAHLLISTVMSASFPTRSNIITQVQKNARTKMQSYSTDWWKELLLLLRIGGYLECAVETMHVRVTQKGMSSLKSGEAITVPATSVITAELYERGKIVIPIVKEEEKREDKEGEKNVKQKGQPVKRVLPSSFNTKISIPNKKTQPNINIVSQARKESGSSRYTGTGFGFMKLAK